MAVASQATAAPVPTTTGLKPAERTRGIVLVTAATFFMWVSLYLYVPFLPLRAQELGASNTMVGAVIASYAIAQIALRVPIGVASDLLGRRKPFAMMAIGAAILGAFWLGVSPDPLSMFFARTVTGVAGAGWVALSILYASYFTARGTAGAMSRIMAVNGIALVLATLGGGWIAEIASPTATFYSGVVAGIIGLFLLFLAPEPPMAERRDYSRATFIAVAKTPLLVLVSTVSVFAHFVTFATSFTFIPIYAENIGASESQIGYVSTSMFAGGVIGTVLAPYIAQKTGHPIAILAGLGLMAGAAVVVPAIDSVAGLGVSQFVGGFGRGLEAAILMTLAVLSVPQAMRATAMGLFQAIYAIGMISGPVAAGAVADSMSIDAVFYVSTAVAIAGGALVLAGRIPRSVE